MANYLISFDEGMMRFSPQELVEVGAAARAVADDAMRQGVWVFGDGLTQADQAHVVDVDGTVHEGPFEAKTAHLGGFCILNVSTREEAISWARRFAAACRCAQEVQAFLPAELT